MGALQARPLKIGPGIPNLAGSHSRGGNRPLSLGSGNLGMIWSWVGSEGAVKGWDDPERSPVGWRPQVGSVWCWGVPIVAAAVPDLGPEWDPECLFPVPAGKGWVPDSFPVCVTPHCSPAACPSQGGWGGSWHSPDLLQEERRNIWTGQMSPFSGLSSPRAPCKAP